jgi:hypothetical protein
MCWTCFKKYTDKPVMNDRVVAAYDLLMDDRVEDSTFLHVIVGDMNVDDYHFDLSDDYNWFAGHYSDADQWERDIFDALAALTEEERATAVAMEWGYINRNGTIWSGIAVP